MKVVIDTSKEEEALKTFGLEIRVVFQGEPYEDPNPPEEEDHAKGKKGKPAPTEPEVRMITPEPQLLENESGRKFRFSLGRME